MSAINAIENVKLLQANGRKKKCGSRCSMEQMGKEKIFSHFIIIIYFCLRAVFA